MTGSEIQKIIESMPDDMHDVLINGLNNAINAMCNIADYMRKNYVLISVIEDIKEEIDKYLIAEEFGSAYRNDIKGIIDKHISPTGAESEGGAQHERP